MIDRIKAVTFNIRCDYGQDGENGFPFRKELIQEILLSECPQIIGFQEVLPHVASWLRDTFPEYYFLGCGREKDLSGEQALSAVRKTRFQLVHLHTFWLSPTPEIRLLLEDSLLTDLTGGLPGTFHDYGRLSTAQKIDYITADSTVKCLSSSLWTAERNGLFLSDHYPVCVEITHS